jgi:hypothetical protein
MFGTTVPEATINQQNDFRDGEHDIDGDALNAPMQPETEP